MKSSEASTDQDTKETLTHPSAIINDEKVAFKESNIELSSRYGSICWLNMIASGGATESATEKPVSPTVPNTTTVLGSKNLESNVLGSNTEKMNNNRSMKDPNNLCTRWMQKLITVFKWVFNDFRLRHLVWIKFIFFFQSASMTVLYPYLNLHMKSLGLK